MSKTWWKSKTLWLNLIACGALALQSQTGLIIDAEAQAGILAIINLILRLITSQALDWNKNDDDSDSSSGTPVNQAGYARLCVLLAMFAIATALFTIPGCATTATTTPAAKDSPVILAGKSLLTVKATITTAAKAVDSLCQAKQLGADKCSLAKDAYAQSKPAYDSAVDAYLLMVQSGDSTKFADSLQRVQNIATVLLTLTGGAK